MTYTLMTFAAGITVEAVILARTSRRMRVVVPGLPDAIELRRSGSQWLAPDHQAVDFDFLMPTWQADGVLTAPRPNQARTAAG